jgi:hypothetical protein
MLRGLGCGAGAFLGRAAARSRSRHRGLSALAAGEGAPASCWGWRGERGDGIVPKLGQERLSLERNLQLWKSFWAKLLPRQALPGHVRECTASCTAIIDDIAVGQDEEEDEDETIINESTWICSTMRKRRKKMNKHKSVFQPAPTALFVPTLIFLASYSHHQVEEAPQEGTDEVPEQKGIAQKKGTALYSKCLG